MQKTKFGYKSVSSISNILHSRGDTANGYHWESLNEFLKIWNKEE